MRHTLDRYDTPTALASACVEHLLSERACSGPAFLIEPYSGDAPFATAALRILPDAAVTTIDADAGVYRLADDLERANVTHYTGRVHDLIDAIPAPDERQATIAIVANPPYRGDTRLGVADHLSDLLTLAADLWSYQPQWLGLGALVPITALCGAARETWWRETGSRYLRSVVCLSPRPSFSSSRGTAPTEYVWCEWVWYPVDHRPGSERYPGTGARRVEWLSWK